MPEHRGHEPRSRFEDEGIPDLAQETPGVPEIGDSDEMPLPGDDPSAVLDFGTTAEEQLRGEPLDDRLAREEPDVLSALPDAADPPHRSPSRLTDAAPDGSTDQPARDPLGADVEDLADSELADLDVQEAWTTDVPGDPAEALELERSTRGAIGFDTDLAVEPAGRLVEPDEGGRTDDEPDAVAADVGSDLGGFTAEEDAMRVQPER